MASHTIAIEPVQINAPIEHVWNVLTNFPAYPEWNPFTVAIETSMDVGSDVILHIQQGKNNIVKRRFRLETLDSPQLLEWSLPKLGHPMLLNAWRIQRLTPVSADSCNYQTSDTFRGLLAGQIYKLQGAWVEKNFIRLASALKARCESLPIGSDQ